VTRKTGKDREEIIILRSEAVMNYPRSMQGVDLAGQNRQYYRIR